jgi:hypothetical protein
LSFNAAAHIYSRIWMIAASNGIAHERYQANC